eukprot:COSAG01_NODE_6086_length_3861_cov_91.695906_8_plen_114_part_00
MIRTEHTMYGNIGESQPIVTMVSFIYHRAIGAGHKVDGSGGGELMVGGTQVLAFSRPVVGKERAAVGLFAAGQAPDLKAVYDTLGAGGGAGHDQRAHGVVSRAVSILGSVHIG